MHVILHTMRTSLDLVSQEVAVKCYLLQVSIQSSRVSKSVILNERRMIVLMGCTSGLKVMSVLVLSKQLVIGTIKVHSSTDSLSDNVIMIGLRKNIT